jgi:hypothetical protein
MTSDLRLEARPCPESNDHEVRIIIDGVDWLGRGFLGLDPPELLSQLAIRPLKRLIVGRCECGCVGCDDLIADARQDGQIVEWIVSERGNLTFDAQHYHDEIARFASDHSWEDLGRMVERRVGEIFASATIEGEASFQWASTRIAANLVHLSFQDQHGQRLFEFGWDGSTLADAIAGARRFRRENCDDADGV